MGTMLFPEGNVPELSVRSRTSGQCSDVTILRPNNDGVLEVVAVVKPVSAESTEWNNKPVKRGRKPADQYAERAAALRFEGNYGGQDD